MGILTAIGTASDTTKTIKFSSVTDAKYVDEVLNADSVKKAYYRYIEGTDVKVVRMTPDEYLKITNKWIGDDKLDEMALTRLRLEADKGTEIDMPFLVYEGKDLISQEGRHRAAIAKERGIKEIPVAIKTDNLPRDPKKWEEVKRTNIVPEELNSVTQTKNTAPIELDEDLPVIRVKGEKPPAPRSLPVVRVREEEKKNEVTTFDPITQRIINSGIGSDYIHSLYGDDPLDAIATDFNLNTVTMKDIELARNNIREISQNILRKKYGNYVTAYRGITRQEGKSPTISWSLNENTARDFARRSGSGEVITKKIPIEDILSYSEAFGKGTFGEEEIIIKMPKEPAPE